MAKISHLQLNPEIGFAHLTMVIHFWYTFSVMATLKKRVNISLASDIDRALTQLARRDKVPQATKAAELLRVGLEVEEDVLLDTVATERYKTNSTRLSHDQVWK